MVNVRACDESGKPGLEEPLFGLEELDTDTPLKSLVEHDPSTPIATRTTSSAQILN